MKTNNRKLLAAIAIFAMLACVFAVVATPASAADTDGVTVTVDGTSKGAGDVTNDLAGNSLTVTQTGENSYLVSGIAMYIGDVSKMDTPASGSIQEAFKNSGAPAGYEYGIVYVIGGLGTSGSEGAKYLGYVNSADQWRIGQKTSGTSEMLKYINTSTGSSTYYILDAATTTADCGDADAGLTEAEAAVKAEAGYTITVSWDLTLVDNRLGDNVVVSMPIGMGMTSSVSGTTYNINLNGTAIAAGATDVCETSSIFSAVFTDAANGYAFVQLNGLQNFFSETVTSIKITQQNSALGVYADDHEENISQAADGSWSKTKVYASTDVANGYAFLIPKDGSNVTITLTTGEGETVTTVATFVINTSGLVNASKVSQASEVEEAFADNTTVILDTVTANDEIEIPVDNENNTLIINSISTSTNFTVTVGDSVVKFTNFSAKNMVLSIGSTVIAAEDMQGDIEADDIELIGSALGDINLVLNEADSDGQAVVPEGETLDLDGNKLTVNAGVDFTANGTVQNGEIIVQRGASFTYSQLGDNVTITNNGGTVSIDDGRGLDNTINEDTTVSVHTYLTGNTVIAEGVTLTVTSNGTLDLMGYNLEVRGTIIVQNRGSIDSSATGGDGIMLTSTGSIQNNGIIGNTNEVKISNATDTTQNVVLYKVNGISVALNRVSGTQDYDMVVYGDVTRVSGATDSTIALNSVSISQNMTVGSNVTMSTTGTVALAKNVTLTVNGAVNGNVYVDNGASVVISGKYNGIIYVYTGIVGASAEVDKKTSTNVTLNGNADGMTVSAARVTYADANGETVVEQRAYIAGAVDAIDDKATASISIVNEIYVIDTVIVAKEVAITANFNLSTDGTVQLNNYDDRGSVAATISYTGASYTVRATDGAETKYYTNFADAMGAIATAYETTVYISGEFDVSTQYTVADGQYIGVDENALAETGITITETGRIDITEDGEIANAAIAQIEGILFVTGGYGCTPANGTYAVLTTDDVTGDKTYSGFKVALDNAQSGQTITVVGEATYKGSMTIDDGITVIVSDGIKMYVTGNLTIAETAKLELGDAAQLIAGTAGKENTITVYGTLDAEYGTVTAAPAVADDPATADVDESKNAADIDLYSTGSTIASFNGTSFPDVNVKINAAYYTDAQTVYTSINKAVDYAEGNSNYPSTITVIGDVTERDDITTDGINILINGGKVVLGNVTLADAWIQTENNGKLTATVTGLTGEGEAAVDSTVAVTEWNGIIDNDVSIAATGTESYETTINAVAGKAVAVNAGTIVFVGIGITTAEDLILTVANGAQLIIDNENDDVTITAPEGLTNNGTITLRNDVDASGVIGGTVAVDDEATLNVTGTLVITGALTVSATEDKEATLNVTGTLQLGETPKMLGDVGSSTASVTGEITLGNTDGTVVVYAGSSVADATIMTNGLEAESTAYTVNGISVATVYGYGDIVTDNAVNDAVIKMKDLDTKDAAGDLTFAWQADGEDLTGNNAIGKYAEVTAEIDYEGVLITLSVGNRITLSIDGVIVNAYQEAVGKLLTIGTHTVSAVVDPGFTGDITITFNGQTVTNGQIQVTSDMIGETVVLSATGNITQDSTTVITGGSSDDGMGLTDYLLIILVVLIVIMAIMVAMRLMRS